MPITYTTSTTNPSNIPADGLIVIDEGATLTFSQNNSLRIRQMKVFNGTLRIENDSTTNGIVFYFVRGNNESDLGTVALTNPTFWSSNPIINPNSNVSNTEVRVNGSGSVIVRGNWIELGTGNGTANQILTHWTTHFLPAVWVETSPGSNQYEIWLNATLESDEFNSQYLYSGLNKVGNGKAGNFFIQGYNTNQTVNTRFSEIYTNQLTFGDGINGNIIPNGCRVRVPNIVIADNSRIGHFQTAALSRKTFSDGIFTFASAGSIDADICIFSNSNLDLRQASAFRFTNVAMTYPLVEECYDGLFDNVGISLFGLRRGNVAGLTYDDVYADARFFMLYVSNLIFRNSAIYSPIPSPRSGANSLTSSTAVLSIELSESILFENNIIISNLNIKPHEYCLRLNSVNNSTIRNCTFIGGGIDILDSQNNVFENIEYSENIISSRHLNFITGGYNGLSYLPNGNRLQNNQIYWIKMRTFLSTNFSTNYDYYDSIPYAVKPMDINDDRFPFFVSAVPTPSADFAGVEVKFERRAFDERNTTGLLGSNTIYEVYRGTTPGFSERTLSELVFKCTSTSSALIGFLDAPTRGSINTSNAVFGTIGNVPAPVYGQMYYYVIRKYMLSTNDFVEVEIPCLCVNPLFSTRNLLLQSETFDNASWSKSASVTVTTNTEASPVQVAPIISNNTLTLSGDNIVFPATANSSISQNITGLTGGETYTFSVFLRSFTNITENITIRITPATGTPVETICNLKNRFRKYSVTITLNAGVTSATVAIIKTSSSATTIRAGGAGFELGSTAYSNYLVTTTAASAETNIPLFLSGTTTTIASNAFGLFSWTKSPGNYIEVVPNAVNKGLYSEFYISTEQNFIPSKETLFASVYSGSLAPGARVLNLNRSNGNKFTNINQIGTGTSSFAANSDAFIGLVQSSRNQFLNITTNFNGGGGNLFNILNFSNSNFAHNIKIKGNPRRTVNARLLPNTNVNNSSGLVLQNVDCDYSDISIEQYMLDVELKSVSANETSPLTNITYNQFKNGGSSIDGISHGTQTLYQAVYDYIFAQCNHRNDLGSFTILFTPSQKDVKPYTITAGTPTFSNTGVLLFTKPGDQIVYTTKKMYGITGFNTSKEPLSYANLLGDSTGINVRSPLIRKEISISTTDIDGFGEWVDISSYTSRPWASSWLSEFNTQIQTANAGENGLFIKFRFTALLGIPFSTFTIGNLPAVNDTIFANGRTGTATYLGYDFQTNSTAAGVLIVDNVQGDWGTTAASIRIGSANGATLATSSPVNNLNFIPQSTSFIGAFEIYTTTDKTILYPINRPSIVLTGLQPNSEVRIYDSNTLEQIIGTENSSTTFNGEYDYFGTPINVFIHIHHLNFEFLRINAVLDDNGLEIPIQQTRDRNYKNV